jgi:RES domain-containing protein
MKVFRISNCKYIDDLKGTGAASFSGRWHNKGTYILYTAASPSLSLLESVVHISNIATSNYCMICLEVPENSILKIPATELPANWLENPSPDIIKNIGDQFIFNNRYLALQLPSAIMPEECNYLLNPNHLLFKQVKVVYKRSLDVDKRLLKLK